MARYDHYSTIIMVYFKQINMMCKSDTSLLIGKLGSESHDKSWYKKENYSFKLEPNFMEKDRCRVKSKIRTNGSSYRNSYCNCFCLFDISSCWKSTWYKLCREQKRARAHMIYTVFHCSCEYLKIHHTFQSLSFASVLGYTKRFPVLSQQKKSRFS